MKSSELLQQYQLKPNRRLGQNFLVDENMKKKMVRLINLPPKSIVLEIGPGLGAMTQELLKQDVQVTAVEYDKKLFDVLKTELSPMYSDLNLIQGDILKFDLSTHFKGKKIIVVGNLPYYITSPIVFHLIQHRQVISSCYLLMQKEVAERLQASPGTKSYGRLGLSVRFFASIEPMGTIPRSCFLPIPQVSSQMVKMTFHKQLPEGVNPELYSQLIQVAFSKRRKQLVNALSEMTDFFKGKQEVVSVLTELNLSPNVRAEELGIGDYLALTRKLTDK